MADLEVPVLIVGGSLVGMSTALLLGYHGIPALTVEHHRGTAIHPRAALINQRTMEIFRSVDIERMVGEKSGQQFDQDGAIMSVETLNGKELAWYIANLNEAVRDVSPCTRVFITQSLLEPLLQKRAVELGAQLRFATQMTSFEQDPDGVTAVIQNRDTGNTQTVRARYMVAADGSRSSIREELGIRMLGRGVFSNSVTIYFRAPVGPLMRGRNLSIIMVVNPTLRGFFRIEKPYESGFLAVHTIGDPIGPAYSGLEEAKADVVGMFGLKWLVDHGAMPKERLDEYYASYVAGIFRTLRFGTGEAHGRAEMMEFSYLTEQHALTYSAGRYAIDLARIPTALAALAKELLEMEAAGDRARAEGWFTKYDRMPAELKTALAATSNIPVDINSVFAFPDKVQ